MIRLSVLTILGVILSSVEASSTEAKAKPGGPSVADYASIQEAVKANPGRLVYVPPGDYEVAETIVIQNDRSGLVGPGRIIQTNPDKAIIRVDHAAGVQIKDLTLTRPEGRMETWAQAVRADNCRDLVLENLQVIDNRTRAGAIEVQECDGCQIRNCLVRNYQRVAVDDRTDNAELGYAFKSIIGTGIIVKNGKGSLVQGNRVIETNLIATPEVKRQHDLGRYVKKLATRGRLASAKDWDEGYTHNWMQGTAIYVGGPLLTDFAQVIGNYVENAGQGFDIHADHIILSQNVVNDALIGMKAMHGSRHVLIVGNQFSKNTLWSMGLMPGAASHPPRAASDGKAAVGPNVDGGSIIANNIVSDFGFGKTRWIWGEGDNGCPIRFDHGQTPENPPLNEVIIQGNIVYDTGRDGILVDGAPKVVPPRYKYAVQIESGATAPRNLHFSNNILHPGSQGLSNVELPH
jgi:Right handed beta helix region